MSSPVLIGYCLPWPYQRGDERMPKGITKAAFMKAHDVLHKSLVAATESHPEDIHKYEVFGLKVRRSLLDKYIEHGLVYLVRASCGNDLKNNLDDIFYRTQLLAAFGGSKSREKFLDIMRSVVVPHNRRILNID